jgi:hypothetical protein
VRRGVSAAEIAALEDVLGRLAANVDAAPPGGPPWTTLADTVTG